MMSIPMLLLLVHRIYTHCVMERISVLMVSMLNAQEMDIYEKIQPFNVCYVCKCVYVKCMCNLTGNLFL